MNMNDVRQKLSSDLLPIYEDEIARGNEVLRVDEPAGSLCPLAVVFRLPLERESARLNQSVGDDVYWHENADPHYEVDGMAGFASKKSRQFIYGPIAR